MKCLVFLLFPQVISAQLFQMPRKISSTRHHIITGVEFSATSDVLDTALEHRTKINTHLANNVYFNFKFENNFKHRKSSGKLTEKE